MQTGSLPAVSNRETFQIECQIIDTETGEAMALTGGTVVFEIRERGCSPALLSATNSDGVEFIPDDLTIQITFSETAMNALCAKTYDVGMTFERDGITRQVIAGTLPVIDGVVA